MLISNMTIFILAGNTHYTRSAFSMFYFCKGLYVIDPLLGFEQVHLVGFDKLGHGAFQGGHVLIRFVLGPGLELGVKLFDLAGSDEIGAGVVVVQDFHGHHTAGAVLLGDQLLAHNVCEAK